MMYGIATKEGANMLKTLRDLLPSSRNNVAIGPVYELDIADIEMKEINARGGTATLIINEEISTRLNKPIGTMVIVESE